MTLWAEIHQQPHVLARLLESQRETATGIAHHIAAAAPESVLIVARGTSDNAARYAQYVWGVRNRLNVGLATPSLFTLYRRPPRLEGALVVGISQSGRSADLVAVIEEAGAQGCPTLAITNHPTSPLARAAGLHLDLSAGPEEAVAATKTYTAQLAAVALLSVVLGGDEEGLEEVPATVEAVLAGADRIAAAAGRFAHNGSAVVLGRGFNHSTAFEWALKLQELADVVAHPYSTADFEHGPVALVSKGFPVLAVNPRGVPTAGVHRLLARLVEELGSRLLVISDHEPTLGLAEAAIRIPASPEWLSPIPAVVAAQLFTYHLAVARGRDPDAPRTISKVTSTF